MGWEWLDSKSDLFMPSHQGEPTRHYRLKKMTVISVVSTVILAPFSC